MNKKIKRIAALVKPEFQQSVFEYADVWESERMLLLVEVCYEQQETGETPPD